MFRGAIVSPGTANSAQFASPLNGRHGQGPPLLKFKRREEIVRSVINMHGVRRAAALAHELAEFGITVNCVSPGMVDTLRKAASATAAPSHHASHKPLLGRRGRPDEIASAVVWLAGPGGRFTTGQTLHVNGGTYLGG